MSRTFGGRKVRVSRANNKDFTAALKQASLTNKKNVKLRFDPTYMKMAADGAL